MREKITEDMIREARRRVEDGESVKTVCAMMGFSKSSFYRKLRELSKVGEVLSGEEDIIICDEDESEKLKKMIDDGLSSGEKFERLRRISDILTDRICDAALDDDQFTTVIASDKHGKVNGVVKDDAGGVRRLNTKAIKEMASTVRVLTECVRSLYGIPTFGEKSRLYLAGKGISPGSAGSDVTVRFIDGIDEDQLV